MIRFEPQFAYLGGRDYVHGPSIFSCFHRKVLNAAGVGPADVAVRRFRVNRLVRQNHVAYVHGPGRDVATDLRGRSLVEMVCEVDGARWTATLADEQTGPVSVREPSFEKDFVGAVEPEGLFAGTAQLIRLVDNESLIQGAVEANKQLHLSTVESRHPGHACKFRFVYCLDYACPAHVPAETGRIAIRNLGVQETGTHLFTLNQAEIVIGDWRSNFRICFVTEDLRAMGFAPTEKTA